MLKYCLVLLMVVGVASGRVRKAHGGSKSKVATPDTNGVPAISATNADAKTKNFSVSAHNTTTTSDDPLLSLFQLSPAKESNPGQRHVASATFAIDLKKVPASEVSSDFGNAPLSSLTGTQQNISDDYLSSLFGFQGQQDQPWKNKEKNTGLGPNQGQKQGYDLAAQQPSFDGFEMIPVADKPAQRQGDVFYFHRGDKPNCRGMILRDLFNMLQEHSSDLLQHSLIGLVGLDVDKLEDDVPEEFVVHDDDRETEDKNAWDISADGVDGKSYNVASLPSTEAYPFDPVDTFAGDSITYQQDGSVGAPGVSIAIP